MPKPEREIFSDPLDAMIDHVLRDETMRPVPAGMFREIQGRVRVAAVVQKVRRRIWAVAGAWVAAGGATAAAAVLAARGFHVREAAANAFPGMMGYADYLASIYTFGGGPVSSAALVPVVAAFTALVAAMGASWVTARRIAR